MSIHERGGLERHDRVVISMNDAEGHAGLRGEFVGGKVIGGAAFATPAFVNCSCIHTSALSLNSLTTPDEIIASRSKPVEDQMSVCLVATRFHLVGEVQVGKLAPTWENLGRKRAASRMARS